MRFESRFFPKRNKRTRQKNTHDEKKVRQKSNKLVLSEKNEPGDSKRTIYFERPNNIYTYIRPEFMLSDKT